MSEKQTSQNPYLDGRREWNERYGDYIAQAKNWRLFALGSMAISAIAVAGVIYIGSQSKIKPYIVEVDKLGQSISAGYIPQMEYDERVVKYAIADFITNFRTVYVRDKNLQKKYALNAYKYLAKQTQAYGQVSTEYEKNSPLLAKLDKNIEVISVLGQSKDSYQVDWKEKSFDAVGHLIAEENYRGILNIQLEIPKTEADIMKNPIGLFIKDISFQKILN